MKDLGWYKGHVQELIHAEEEMDGCDYAYYQGCMDILSACGDGGVSENYIRGVKYILSILTDEAIEGNP